MGQHDVATSATGLPCFLADTIGTHQDVWQAMKCSHHKDLLKDQAQSEELIQNFTQHRHAGLEDPKADTVEACCLAGVDKPAS